MRKRILVSVASAAAIAGVSGVIATSNGTRAYAQQTRPQHSGAEPRQDWQDAIEQAFTNVDYPAWHTLVEQSPGKGRKHILEIINADNFSRFAEAHRLALKGDVKEANAIRLELNLPPLSETKFDSKHRGNGLSWQVRQSQPAT